MIKQYVTGNLVTMVQRAVERATVEEGARFVAGHGCNCHDAMHSGIAWEMQRAFPIVREMDSKYHQMSMEDNTDMLGSTVPVHISHEVYVLNMYTQFYPGADCRYDAIKEAFESANFALPKSGFNTLFIPRIGAGVAGGDWDKISAIINEVTPDLNVIVVDWDGTVFDDPK